MAKRGEYKKWLEKDGLTLLAGWARDGGTDDEIARRIGCTTRTLYAWKAKYPEIAQALKNGKEVVDYVVENALLRNALAGDTTAQIFWLKNRRPHMWRDKPEAKRGDQKSGEALGKLMEALHDDDN